MKQVIQEKQKTIALISIDETSNEKVYVARGDRDNNYRYWLLILKPALDGGTSKYMFQDVNSNRLGHSGRTDTVQEAIKRILDSCYEGHMTDVFEFDNMFEAAEFIVKE